MKLKKPSGRLKIISEERIIRGAGAPIHHVGSKLKKIYGMTRPKNCPLCLSKKSPSGSHAVTKIADSWKCTICNHTWR